MNADGHLDYLSATFAGTTHLAMGTEKGFDQPEQMRDRNGEFILISSYWDFDQGDHLDTGRSMPDGEAVNERCTSALAFDWDNDGDYDLLLGSYDGGRLFLQMNEGTATEPQFSGRNIPVMTGGVPFELKSKLTTPKLVDWDQDGDLDLIAGTYEDRENDLGGGVYLALNEGKVGSPKFGALQTLIAPETTQGNKGPTRPDSGLYPDVLDYDGDGDLDLVVAGYSVWQPEGRSLTEQQVVEVETLRAGLKEIEKAMRYNVEDISLATQM